jgi:hypothetical protein
MALAVVEILDELKQVTAFSGVASGPLARGFRAFIGGGGGSCQ